MQITEEAKKKEENHTHTNSHSRMNFFEIKTFKAKQLGVSNERKEKKRWKQEISIDSHVYNITHSQT